LEPIQGAKRQGRERLGLRGEFALALLPTVVVLAVFALVETFSKQRLLFAGLASSAFLIYLDPQHGTTRRALWSFRKSLRPRSASRRTPFSAQLRLASLFEPANESNLLLFGLAVGLTATQVGLQGAAL
jgi:hypothetical protein